MEDSTADMCSRCASIPWDELEHIRFELFWRDEKPTLGDLQSSSCRLCRLIAYTIQAQPSQDARPQFVCITYRNRDSGFGDNCLGSLELWTEPGGPVGKLILTTEASVGQEAAARLPVVPKRVSFASMRPYLEACKASHQSCEPETSPQLLNLRVIDCIDDTVVVAPIGCSFVALSYVWGGPSANSYVLGSQIAFPPTIEDAVSSTRELGYRYLWVDRYCIDQKDTDDKKEQINQMGRIYASAQVTIAAAAGVDPTHGLVGISRDRSTLLAREPVGSSRYLCQIPQSAQHYIIRSPWFSRAWTFQEGYLSKRILCFTEGEAVFTCKSHDLIMESGQNSRVHGDWYGTVNGTIIRTALSTQGNCLSHASKIMETYSARVRGHDSDALNAIFGILNVLRHGNPPVYHNRGVPFTITRRPDVAHSTDSTVSISLDWQHLDNARRLPEFPSWSTLGWIGEIYHHRESQVTSHFMIKYWSGDRYRELDEGTCDLDYTYRLDGTHQSQYLEIMTDVVQVELQFRSRTYFLKPTFLRRKRDEDQEANWTNENMTCPFFRVVLDDEKNFDATLPVLCSTTTPLDFVSGSWGSFQDRHPIFLFFQKGVKSYERIGVCDPDVYTIGSDGHMIKDDKNMWEFVPPGEPGAWDQVAERRTFLLG